MKFFLFIAAIFYIFILVNVVSAQSATSVDLGLSNVGFANPTGPADLVLRIFEYAIYIAGTLAFVMIIYGGIQYVISAGNEASKKDAKEIIIGAVWGIGLLAGGWLILNTINPQIVSLSNLNLQNITMHGNQTVLEAPEDQTETGGSYGGTSIGCTTGNTNMNELKSLASSLLSENVPGFQIRNSSTCDMGDAPLKNIEAVRDGLGVIFCDNWTSKTNFDSTCKTACVAGGGSGTKTLCPNLLRGLISLKSQVEEGTIPGFTVTSIAGYLHSSPSSIHYQGRAVDISVSGSDGDWDKVLAAVINTGASAFIEDPTTSNKHIHATFGGAGSVSQEDREGLSDKLKNLAKQIDLSPLKNDSSFGFPPNTKDYACPKESAPYYNVFDVSNGGVPTVCNGSAYGKSPSNDFWVSSCKCNKGGQNGNVTLGERLLQKLIDLQNERKPGGKLEKINYRVVAITGGIQERGSRHYSGQAFDIIPMDGSSISTKESDWITLLNEANKSADAKIQYDMIYTYKYVNANWIEGLTLKTKTDQSTTNGQTSDENNAPIFMCNRTSFSGMTSPILYDKSFDANKSGDFVNSSLSQSCYNPRIHVNFN